jgi:hypothetical protein
MKDLALRISSSFETGGLEYLAWNGNGYGRSNT